MGTRWWVIAEPVLLEALRACANGEDADIVLMELLANAHSQHIRGDTEEPE